MVWCRENGVQRHKHWRTNWYPTQIDINFQQVERWMYEGSSLTIHSILKYELSVLEIGPEERRSYFPLQKELINPLKEFINIRNEDNKYFRRCLVR